MEELGKDPFFFLIFPFLLVPSMVTRADSFPRNLLFVCWINIADSWYLQIRWLYFQVTQIILIEENLNCLQLILYIRTGQEMKNKEFNIWVNKHKYKENKIFHQKNLELINNIR